jgi:hypothetical protein
VTNEKSFIYNEFCLVFGSNYFHLKFFLSIGQVELPYAYAIISNSARC